MPDALPIRHLGRIRARIDGIAEMPQYLIGRQPESLCDLALFQAVGLPECRDPPRDLGQRLNTLENPR